MDTVFDDLALRGYAVIADALGPSEVGGLLAAFGELPPLTPDEQRAGLRDVFTRVPLVRELAAHPAIRGWPQAVLGPAAFAVRALYFDKTPEANWKVSWHQDVTIPTATRAEVSGFGPWSEKAGAPHVQPPTGVLEGMLTVRLHLDDCDVENGPVRVIPGSHRVGKLSAEQADDLRQRIPEVTVPVPAGGLLLMRPLLLHASSPAAAPRHRRVLHLEYAAAELPGGLRWRERWGSSLPSSRISLSRLGRRVSTLMAGAAR